MGGAESWQLNLRSSVRKEQVEVNAEKAAQDEYSAVAKDGEVYD